MTEGRTVGLAEALAGLVEVGVAHGVDEASVRAEGEALHKAGKHQESIDTLSKAMKILGI